MTPLSPKSIRIIEETHWAPQGPDVQLEVCNSVGTRLGVMRGTYEEGMNSTEHS